ncbi:GTP cyclohydrolase I FolE [Spiribacter roseus]|uniref:GTP cyclohydrolase 1 n=1 Tax=Spiribacter roseus TaxID=1855875 RepID=A0ABV3RUH8_9GAMM
MNPDLDHYFEQIITGLGEDPSRGGLEKTPYRAARAMEYLTQGYHQSLDELVNGAMFESDNDEMVIVRDIEFYSLCEHHVLPFFGHAQVGYIPDGRVIGLSKIARVVDMYARRLQIQENLAREVAEAIQQVTQARGVAVQMDAQHMCMMMRGVSKQNAEMSSSVMLGTFRESVSARNEFLQLIRRRPA